MRVFLTVLVLIFGLHSWTYGDDARDFEIEGMSIGDSLLDYYSEEEIKKKIMSHWYQHLKKNVYFIVALSDFQTYDFIDISIKHNDNKYIIDSLSGAIYFGQNKEVKNLDDCYIKQKKMANELSILFKNSKKFGPKKITHKQLDPSGKSTYTDIMFLLDSGYVAGISCYDYSEDLKKHEDFMSVAIRSKNFDDWLGGS